MNLRSPKERDDYIKKFKKETLSGQLKQTERVVLCPPVIYLEKFIKNIKSKKVSFGAQNAHQEERGAFTGEVSVAMVKNIGAEYLIIGHSERRKYFGEDDESVNQKIVSALKKKIKPIVCVGESAEERSSGKIKEKIFRQISVGLKDIAKVKIPQIIIAYEPIWAIGTGNIPSMEDIMEINILIKKILVDKFGLSVKKAPRVIYGGSVNADNIKETCLASGMDGVLVGGESLSPKDFWAIVKVIENSG